MPKTNLSADFSVCLQRRSSLLRLIFFRRFHHLIVRRLLHSAVNEPFVEERFIFWRSARSLSSGFAWNGASFA
jgi:hypothetical protein